MNAPDRALHTQTAEDWELILEAAIDGDSQVVETLLNGCNLSASSFAQLQNVLYFAGIHKQAAVIEYRLASGLDPNGSYGPQRRRSLLNIVLGRNPLSRLQFNEECRTLECVRVLLRHSARVDHMTPVNRQPWRTQSPKMCRRISSENCLPTAPTRSHQSK